MFPIKVLQFPKTSLERVLGYILCPNQSSVMFLPTSMVIGRHKNNWWILKLVLNKWNESHIPSHILPHFRSLIWVWWKWINKLKSELNYLLSILTSCSRSFLYHFFYIIFYYYYHSYFQYDYHSRLSPCGHLAITDTPSLRTRASLPARRLKKWLKLTTVITNSRYYGNAENFMPPSATIHLFFLSL